MTTKIQWADVTWNPARGCTAVDEGCRHCYAQRVAGGINLRHRAYEGLVRETPRGWVWTGEVRTVADKLRDYAGPRMRPRAVFVNSMSDLFHPAIPDEFIDAVFAAMVAGARHRFIVLTKRHERLRDYMALAARALRVAHAARLLGEDSFVPPGRRPTPGGGAAPANRSRGSGEPLPRQIPWPPANVAVGISAHDQAALNARWAALRETPAAVRVLSLEPLLGPVDHLPADLRGGDWVICGGESGGRVARPMRLNWARSVRDACGASDIPFFFKQQGDWLPVAPETWDEARAAGMTGWLRVVDAAGRIWPAHTRPSAEDPLAFKLRGTGEPPLETLDGVEHKAVPAGWAEALSPPAPADSSVRPAARQPGPRKKTAVMA